jgi:hypothetical protein
VFWMTELLSVGGGRLARQKQIPFGDDNQKSKSKGTARARATTRAKARARRKLRRG